MRIRIAVYATFAVALLVCASGCSDSTSPEENPGVVLSLEAAPASEDGEDFIVAVVRVENLGLKRINYGPACDRSVGLTVEDMDGNRIHLWDPTLVRLCPPVWAALAIGEEVSEEWPLRRTWDEEGVEYPMPAGSYMLRTVFRYNDGTEDGNYSLEKTMQVELD